MAFFSDDSWQECGLDHIRFTIKFSNPGGSKAKALYSGNWDFIRAVIIERVEDILGIENPVTKQKTTSFGYNTLMSYSNGVEIQYHDDLRYMGVMIELHGDTLRSLRQVGFTDFKLCKLLGELEFDDIDEHIWFAEAKRIDSAIDYYNSSLNVNTLANKIIHHKTIEVCYDHWDRKTNEYSERVSRAEAYAHMNHGIYNTLYLGRPGGSFQIRIYNKIEEARANGRSVPTNVNSWIRYEIEMHEDMSKSFMGSALATENDEEFKRLIYRFGTRKMKLKQTKTGNYHSMTQDMMERANGAQIVEYSKAKPKDLLRAKFEHMLNGSGLVSFVQILNRVEKQMNQPGLVDGFFEVIKAEAQERPLSSDLVAQWNTISDMIESDENYRVPFAPKEQPK